jgi:hypothetical protein
VRSEFRAYVRAHAEPILLAHVVAAVSIGVAAFAAHLPRRVALGDLLLAGAALLLVQGLVRDVARLVATARDQSSSHREPGARRSARCTCVESGIGVFAIVAGAVLVFAGSSMRFAMPAFAWPALTGGVTLIGWLVRDVVFDLRVRRFRLERDHASLDLR